MLAAGALACLALRFRRSSGEERQQLKWFTYAVAVLIVGLAILGALNAIFGAEYSGFLDALLLMLVPIAAGIGSRSTAFSTAGRLSSEASQDHLMKA